MKKLYSLIFLLFTACNVFAQTNNYSFFVGGDQDKYYPVKFADANWVKNKETVIEIGRSLVHTDTDWSGSLISKFSYHVTDYGHGSNFIQAQIRQYFGSFIGGWADGTSNNSEQFMLVWLRGATTYYLNSQETIVPIVHDGVQNPSSYQETNGPVRTFLSQPESYVANYAIINNFSARYLGDGNNYFYGNVGIGTYNPQEKLSVNGKIRAREIKVETANWPDYVFSKDYRLPDLKETETFIKTNGHLPGVPSATVAEKEGIELGEMNKILLKKIEEMMLYLIKEKNEKEELKERVIKLEEQAKGKN